MINGVTKSGFSFRVSEKLGNDFRFVRAFARVKSGEPAEQLAGTVQLAEVILGPGGVDALCEHVAEPDGSVPTDAVMRELTEIVDAAKSADGAVKN